MKKKVMVWMMAILCFMFLLSGCQPGKEETFPTEPPEELKQLELGVYYDADFTQRVDAMGSLHNTLYITYDGEEHPLYFRFEYQGEPVNLIGTPSLACAFTEEGSDRTHFIHKPAKEKGEYLYSYLFDGDMYYKSAWLDFYLFIQDEKGSD